MLAIMHLDVGPTSGGIPSPAQDRMRVPARSPCAYRDGALANGEPAATRVAEAAALHLRAASPAHLRATRSKRSRFVTLVHAATKSRTNLSCASELA